MDLLVFRVYAGVEVDRLVAGEDGGGAGPAAVLVKGLTGEDGWRERLPVDKVGGDGVCPHNVPPHCTFGVVLIEKMVNSLVVHRAYLEIKDERNNRKKQCVYIHLL